ncbi:RNA polymerase sigma factor for flagellar operon [Gracilibacillus boraciitolerans JCM 21714]|uniref:RNA polymerase sigma factor for flagellar operon n=1 Tax=Gracilibacillus boraciitolerans JCM 21714 TaxID=1298598 RepID=W4VEK7_9BACI|nr:FliA/WhiG family RNA polymerase sigma factor [Gracilibacillus boraciitolerans]GAE91601.1 RNA polymerase sigma factor for flagellar operon [Gracilibacillus boraciitolerans JCM 21714]
MVKDTTLEDYLWKNWFSNKSEDNTNALIENYMYLVQYHVQRITINLPKSVHKDDIRSLGLIGLYDAILKFDPSRDLKFDTYASFRIKGAIIDGLRKEDWLPRTTRDKVKRIDHAIEELQQSMQREILSEDIATHLGLTAQEVEETLKDSFFANLLSMEEKNKSSSEDVKEGIGQFIPDDREPLPEENVVQKESYQVLAKCIKKLNENEQLVVSLFYEKDLTFTEIGKILSLTTSRISQIHKQAIIKVRQSYQKYNSIGGGA